MDPRQQLEERRSQVTTDLTELADQVATGEIDAATADHLREVYEAELADIDAALATMEPAPKDESPVVAAPVPPKSSRSSYPVAIGAAVVLGILTGVIVLLGTRSTSADGDTDVPPEAVVEAAGIDVGSMTVDELESSLSTFPESTMVRLALADRYLEMGERTTALEHYLIVASGETPPSDRSRALARIGYLSYATGQFDSARDALEDSLAFDPNNTEAMLYMGYVLLNGYDDTRTATFYFDKALDDPDMPREIVDAVVEMLAEASQGEG